MKKFYTNVVCMFGAMACMTVANAQQLTNSTFEDEWVDCVPGLSISVKVISSDSRVLQWLLT